MSLYDFKIPLCGYSLRYKNILYTVCENNQCKQTSLLIGIHIVKEKMITLDLQEYSNLNTALKENSPAKCFSDKLLFFNKK